jgi:uncharacterized protein YcsI (UPF0317 family)
MTIDDCIIYNICCNFHFKDIAYLNDNVALIHLNDEEALNLQGNTLLVKAR